MTYFLLGVVAGVCVSFAGFYAALRFLSMLTEKVKSVPGTGYVTVGAASMAPPDNIRAQTYQHPRLRREMEEEAARAKRTR